MTKPEERFLLTCPRCHSQEIVLTKELAIGKSTQPSKCCNASRGITTLRFS